MATKLYASGNAGAGEDDGAGAARNASGMTTMSGGCRAGRDVGALS